jgi:CrcB protein
MALFWWICLGGAIGTGARYALSGWLLKALGASFPYGTLAVNVLGSFLVGSVMYAGLEAGMIPPTLRVALATGVLGGFTTYSSFSYETLRYIQEGAWLVAALNLAATFLGCLAACFLGWTGARWLLAP